MFERRSVLPTNVSTCIIPAQRYMLEGINGNTLAYAPAMHTEPFYLICDIGGMPPCLSGRAHSPPTVHIVSSMQIHVGTRLKI